MFANVVMDVIAAKALNTKLVLPPEKTIEWIWENTPTSAKLRQSMVDCFACLADLDDWFTNEDGQVKLPLDFVCEVSRVYYRLTYKLVKVRMDFEKVDIGRNCYVNVDEKVDDV